MICSFPSISFVKAVIERISGLRQGRERMNRLPFSLIDFPWKWQVAAAAAISAARCVVIFLAVNEKKMRHTQRT